METIHVKFDELTTMDSEHNSLEPIFQRFINDDSSSESMNISSKEDLDNFFGPMYKNTSRRGLLETDIRKRTKNKAKNDKIEHEMEKSEIQSQLKAGDSKSQQKSQPRQIQVNKRRLEG
ncbi:hypothetical protein Tco_0368817 [Tanacetum coccineum]